MAELLGDDFAENRSKKSMWRDHGLVEFFWERVEGRWAGTHFSVQAHRLRYPEAGLVNRVVRDRYGDFPGLVTFDEVGALLADRGVPLREVPYPAEAGELRAYWQPDAQIVISVVEGSYYGRAGDLYRVASSSTGIP
ncbi:hypothetical protein H4696_003823 [Amycolatopsis lexingtonensis]|uniref:Uncharacterized protein n=1 Tax=Amycolatopsis lexingtonensis TaxID=218822 RepID=A0ABR9I0L6_9PSEU|nr:hypothetical protein [Amycolatopsis lexingtonensis]MBE1496723.1 hypothetical protein [Amycolatopsis lexingtonensis]